MPIDSRLWHDVRGVLAAASANAEYVRSRELPEDLASVVREIEHEIRLASDVIGVVGGTDRQRMIEVDLRALLLVARGGSALQIDATQPPFVVCGQCDALEAFAARVVAATSSAATVTVDDGSCIFRGLDAKAAAELSTAAVVRDVGLAATAEGDSLILRRP
jgi:hypothetical protein